MLKSWTKDVNIFDKDYIVCPINEDFHWYVKEGTAVEVLSQDKIFLKSTYLGLVSCEKAVIDG